MQEYNWIEMMNHMQELRLFCSLTVKSSKKEGITSAQELDLLSRIALTSNPLTPQDLTRGMGLQKSAVSRLIRNLEQKRLLEKVHDTEDRRSYTLCITPAGTEELNQTYHYYLDPIYRLRRSAGEEKFRQFT